MTRLLLLSTLLAVGAACQAPPDEAGDVGLPTPAITIRTSQAVPAQAVSQDERFAFHDASSDALADTRRVLGTSATWQEAHARLQTLTAEQRDPVRARTYAQAAATRMLQPGVITDETPEAARALTGYAAGLLAVDGVDAPLLAGALGRAAPLLRDGEAARLAAEALDAIEAHEAAIDARRSGEPASRRIANASDAAYAEQAAEAEVVLRRLALR